MPRLLWEQALSYDLMILADPGPERAEVLRVLGEDPAARGDRKLDNRFWITTGHGEAQLNIGTKDPVESIHLEMETADGPLLEAATRWALRLAGRLDMRVEDVLWGHEVTEENLPRLKEYWAAQRGRGGGAAAPPETSRPWWRFWS